MDQHSSTQPRILGVFAHPDHEVFVAGGTLAKYAAAGAEIMVVSATKGQAGQIRDASIATRRTLSAVREQELHRSCQLARQLGHYARAAALYEESLAIMRELGDLRGVALSLGNLGAVACDRGEYARRGIAGAEPRPHAATGE
jgi:LmbE family N-acetylglucosaminyl deacetylase